MTELPWPSPEPADAAATGADGFVRHARAEDVEGITRAQAAAWRQAYAALLPAATLAALDGVEAHAAWADAVASQAPRRHVLVATVGAPGEPGTVVGVAALTASGDPDLDPSVDAELAVLVVDPAHGRQGHGSRLLAAAVDLLREDDFTHVFSWVPSTDDALRRLLVESGWAADGARRTLGTDGEPGADAAEAHQLRMLTDLRVG